MENKHTYAIRGITEKHISCKNQILITSSVHDHLLNCQNSNVTYDFKGSLQGSPYSSIWCLAIIPNLFTFHRRIILGIALMLQLLSVECGMINKQTIQKLNLNMHKQRGQHNHITPRHYTEFRVKKMLNLVTCGIFSCLDQGSTFSSDMLQPSEILVPI